jgi:hypothetical protein
MNVNEKFETSCGRTLTIGPNYEILFDGTKDSIEYFDLSSEIFLWTMEELEDWNEAHP